MTRSVLALAASSTLCFAGNPIPVQGMPVPELANFDALMTQFMTDNDIDAAVLGIMRSGVIVYQRGFGWKDADHTTLLRHDALMRIASCSKPITAAALQRLIAANVIDDTDIVFNLGQPGGGILPMNAFGTLADNRYNQIQVQHLYTHTSGLPSNQGNDPTYQEVQIADDMGVASPPGRWNTLRWIMGNRALSGAPGAARNYSNVGFLAAGLVVEQVSGMSHLAYVRQNVFGPMPWMPVSEVVAGRTFPGDRDPREPWYDDTAMVQNVFDPDGDAVRRPDGGWDHESRIGQGGFVVSTTALLHLAEMYYISDNQAADPTYGTLVNGARQYRWHNGSLPGGTMSMTVQRADGVNYVVLFNKNGTDVNSGSGYHFAIQALIDAEITGGGFSWPTQGVDGQWVDLEAAPAGEGSYETPWNDVTTAMAASSDEATVNFKPGSSDWTGVINQRVRLRSPQGLARIGQ
ncbi:MAG: beta-lactamase family protein [Phycisphaerales bacterium]|nr:beta-lactamase family protein [Phycisphaerales bacterium]